MAYAELKGAVLRRLEEGDRGDRGWFVTTRVHLTADRLRGIVEYLHDVGAENGHAMTELDYRALGTLLGIGAADPGVTIRRHDF